MNLTLSQKKILRVLRDKAPLIPAEICTETGLEKSTVSRLLRTLEKQVLVQKDSIIPAGKKGGRTSQTWSINPSGGYVLCVHIMVSSIDCGVMDLAGEMHDLRSFAVEKTKPDIVISKLLAALNSYKIFIREKKEKIIGCGIASPGLIDIEQGIVISAVNLIGWNQVPLRSIVEKEIQIPVTIDNNVQAHAYAELIRGAAKSTTNSLVLSCDYGIGLGIIINRQIYRGTRGVAGDLHMSTPYSKERCYCGRVGCIETVASAKHIINTLSSSKVRTSDDLIKILIANDLHTHELCSKAGGQLGQITAYLAGIFDPDNIILGGCLAMYSKKYCDSLKQNYKHHAIKNSIKQPEIVVSQLPITVPLNGAGWLAFEELFV